MKQLRDFVLKALVTGLLVVVPLYLTILLLLKAVQSFAGLLKPITGFLPEWFPAEHLLALLIVLIVCFLIGAAVLTRHGRIARDYLEKSLFARIPGYALFKSLSLQVAERSEESTWQPALIEIEDALVPGFIIEELDAGLVVVFVPSVPTPLAGATYILTRTRVHPVDVSFAYAVKVISRWGSGSRELVAAMKRADAAR